MSKRIKLDPNNFNRHTEGGMELLESSIKEVGAIEGITIDAKGEIISGNARFQTFEKLGYKPKIIELSENEYPVIATKLEGEKRVKAAILANTVAKKNISLDIDLIQEVAVEEYDIDIEEIGVEDVNVDMYQPNLNPTNQNRQVGNSDFDKANEKLDDMFSRKSDGGTMVMCPSCGNEFEIKQ